MSLPLRLVRRDRRPPRIVVYGQYKTGTTACFFKIRNSLRSPPIELFEATRWDPSPADANRSVLAKVIVPATQTGGLEPRLSDFRDFNKAIYLLRDPRDWLVSGVLFLTQEYKPFWQNQDRVDAFLALLQRKERKPSSVALLSLLDMIIASGDLTAADWLPEFLRNHFAQLLSFEDRLGQHVTWRYEDFISGRQDRIERYLGFPLLGSAEPDSAFTHVPRSRSAGNWCNWLTEGDVAQLVPLLQPYIERHDYPRDWTLNAEQHIDPRHGTAYVAQIVASRRHRAMEQAQDDPQ